MEQIQAITRFINVFNSFFYSINNLFCQIRWLQSNFGNTSPGVLIAVGCVVIVCLMFSQNMIKSEFLNTYLPIIVVVGILVFAYLTRSSNNHNTSLDGVMFGANTSSHSKGVGGHHNSSIRGGIVSPHGVMYQPVAQQEV